RAQAPAASAHARGVLDVKADASPAIPVIGDETARHMQGMIALAQEHLAEIAAECPEGDRLDAASVRRSKRAADMIGAGAIGKEDAMGGEREERRGIAAAIGARLLQELDKVEVHGRRRQRAIEFERAPGRKLERMREAFGKERLEL